MYLFNVSELPGPIVNLPVDVLQVRIRYRQDDFTTAYVRTPAGVTQHALTVDEFKHVRLIGVLARNETLKVK